MKRACLMTKSRLCQIILRPKKPGPPIRLFAVRLRISRFKRTDHNFDYCPTAHEDLKTEKTVSLNTNSTRYFSLSLKNKLNGFVCCNRLENHPAFSGQIYRFF